MNLSFNPRVLCLLAAALFSTTALRAQWQTQSFDLVPGWNAIYTHVDASHATLSELMALDPLDPIEEIWLWKPASTTLQFIQSPQQPTGTGSQWSSWERALGASSDLNRIFGNQALLVRLGGQSAYIWTLKGRPVASQYNWTTAGQNFIGFPTVPDGVPTFETFLAPAPNLHAGSEIFHYQGGELGPDNPRALVALRTTPVRRGEAFWIRSKENVFNRYFGPFELVLGGAEGLGFGDSTGQIGFRLRNLTAESLTITLTVLDSEVPPDGEIPIVQTAPLLLRGSLSNTDLTFDSTELNPTVTDGDVVEPQTMTLLPRGEPGSEIEVVIGVNRSLMTGAAGDLYAGILRLRDSLGFVQYDLPVTATVASQSGLWVGSAIVNQVRHQIKTFSKDLDGAPVLGENGAYVSSGENTSFGGTARSFPLRLIVHHDGTDTRLLQRVYHGVGAGGVEVLATRQELLDNTQLASARRVSSTQLPWTEGNAPWTFTGSLTQGSALEVSVDLAHDNQASNPFLHTYHPDHDNLNATFDAALEEGAESLRVERVIRLSVTPPGDDFASLTGSTKTMVGRYEETIILHSAETQSRAFAVQGGFALNRVSSISTLIQ